MAIDNALLSKNWVLETETNESLTETYKVKIRDLILEMSIGIHPHEKKRKQRVSINLEMILDYPSNGFSDAVYRKVACYETLINEIKDIISEGHIILVETFAEKIADITLSDKRVFSVSVNVEKLDVFDDCEGVGAIIEKTRKHKI
jgi:dihydroneopterin aldolase